MAKEFLALACIAVGVAACSNQTRTEKPVWSANYNLPFDAMVACLSAPPEGAFAVTAPTSGFGGVVHIGFTPASMPQVAAQYVVYRLPENASQVSWRRPDNVGGFDWVDVEARQRANRCGGVPFQGL